MSVRVIESEEFLSSLLRIVEQKSNISSCYARAFIEEFKKELLLLKRFPSIGSPTKYRDARGQTYRKVRVDDALLFYIVSSEGETIRLGYLFNEREDYDSLLS